MLRCKQVTLKQVTSDRVILHQTAEAESLVAYTIPCDVCMQACASFALEGISLFNSSQGLGSTVTCLRVGILLPRVVTFAFHSHTQPSLKSMMLAAH